VAVILYNGKNPFDFLTPEIGFVFGGFLSWGFATSMGHRLTAHKSNLVHSGLQMLLAGAAALAFSAFIYDPLPVLVTRVSPQSWIAAAYLTVFGGLGFYAYSYLISKEPSIRVVSYAIVNPGIAVLLGILLGNEKPVPFLLIGFPLILAGLVFMLYGQTLFDRIRGKGAKADAKDE
jgi:drug/metabolite transporter (DMT)-like permease